MILFKQAKERGKDIKSKRDISPVVTRNISAFYFVFIIFVFILVLARNGIGILLAGYGARLSNPYYNIFEPFITVSILCYLGFLLFSTGVKHRGVKSLLLTVIIVIFLYIHGKRFIAAQFVMLFVYSLFLCRKINGKAFVGLCVIAFVGVIGFAYIYGVAYKSNTSSLVEYMLIDMSRHYTLMYQFFCSKSGIAISVNPMDAIVSDLTFFIPRSIWETKPYPFSNSITMSLVGLPPANENLGWSTTITVFSDLFNSFSYFGLIIGLAFLYFIMSKIDNSNDSTIKILGMYAVMNIFTVQFAAFITPMLIFIVLLFVAKRVVIVKKGTVSNMVISKDATC